MPDLTKDATSLTLPPQSMVPVTVDAVDFEALNPKERILLASFQYAKVPATIAELASLCDYETHGARSASMANSWTRNSLRRLLREGYIERVARGTYQLTGAALWNLTK